jgi:MFS transporter, NNP family, nitrate/nitrite transporter
MHMPASTPKGAKPTVFVSFLHFDLCFTLWVLLGALGIFITKDLHLNAAQQGLLVAVPTLSGSLMRVVIGFLSDRFPGKHVGTGLLVFLFLPLVLGWLLPASFPEIIAVGLMLGVAGSSFAVALPLASRWYPPEKQGLVMGIAAAGNIGTVLTNLSAPALAIRYGWHNVLGLSTIPLAAVVLVFLWLAKDSPNRPPRFTASQYLSTLRRSDLWYFCLFYSVTFGGFVGLSTFLPLFLRNQYAFSPVNAGLFTALAAFLASTLRPLGGYLSDKIGGVRMLTVLLAVIAVLYALISRLPVFSLMSVLLLLIMSCLGMGNGSVFQLVPQRFRHEIGIASGIVGALGGIGGFYLPTILGSVKQVSHSYSVGFLVLAGIAVIAFVVLRILVAFSTGWRFSLRPLAESPIVESPVAETELA